MSAHSGAGLPTVLIVDDEPLITSILSRLIRKDHTVQISMSGTEARERLRAGERFDAIVCDLMMPGVTGMDLHADLSLFAPEQAARMIFMTGGAFTEATRGFLDRVSNPRIEKPFNVSDVRDAIAVAIRRGAR
jgi:CheY-like chemotaxis protein